MKVLFLMNLPSPYRVDFFNELGRLCDLTVLYEREDASNRDKQWRSNGERCYKEIFLQGIKVGEDCALCVSVRKYLKDKSYDIIVVGEYATPTGMITIQYLRSHKISYLLNSDGGIIQNDNKLKSAIKHYFIANANAYLSTGKKTDDYLMYYGADKNNIYRYPFTSLKMEDILTAVTSQERKEFIKQELHLPEQKVILSVGQFIPRKGYDVLLKACEKIDPSVGVYIVGGDPLQEYIDMKEELHLDNIHFIPFMTKEKLKNYYKMADVFVLPTREDIWGLVINEAMAYGLPIITTQNCIAGVELVNENENGFLVPVNDEMAIAEKINTIINNDKLRKKMSVNNLEKIKRYTIEQMAITHMKIFKKILGE